MCILTQCVQEVDNDIFDDAVVIQPKQDGFGGTPDYLSASAILHRVHTPHTDRSWIFQTLLHLGDKILTGAGIIGSIDDVIKAAHYQFGTDMSKFDCISVNYCDNSFPKSLIPSNII